MPDSKDSRTSRKLDNPPNLASEEKKVFAKVLTEAGYSSRTVEKMLGVSDTAVLTYAEAETPRSYSNSKRR